ncbi:MAG TPA: hypothetical protein VK095_00625 [Beutenbergiaceae bacterium]|nr:hypothetical protein [Beutenbergiaceae bacterium]
MDEVTSSGPDRTAPDGSERPAERHDRGDGPPPWLRTSAVVVGGALLLVAVIVVASALLPRWWADLVGRQVDGVGSAGILWGVFYGVVFTAVPLLVGFLAIRPRWQWKVRLGVGALAVALTAPNLLTLAVSVGASEATQAARTVLSVQAPHFRVATLSAVVLTLLVAAVAGFFMWRLVASRKELHKLRDQTAQGERPALASDTEKNAVPTFRRRRKEQGGPSPDDR